MRTVTPYLATFLLAALFLTGCSPATELSVSLAVISDATEAATLAVPVLEASNVIPTPLGNTILTYTSAVGTAASQSSTELLSSDTAAQKALEIAGYFSQLAIPALGSANPKAAAIVQAIESAVNLFLSQLQSPAASKAIKSGAADSQKLSYGDRRNLSSLARKLNQTAAKAKSLCK